VAGLISSMFARRLASMFVDASQENLRSPAEDRYIALDEHSGERKHA
jgi:hypothetical protein